MQNPADIQASFHLVFLCTKQGNNALCYTSNCPLSLFLPQERKLCAFPTIEICSSDVINYMVPLSRQTDFFVPEMKEEVKTDVKEEDSDEDRGTDITGTAVHFCSFQPSCYC